MKPSPLIRYRERSTPVYEDLLKQGAAQWFADIVAKRIAAPVTLESCCAPSLANIGNPAVLPDMDKAVERIVRAVINREQVVFCVDHDMDGQASAAVLWQAFVEHFQVPEQRLSVVTSHRLTEGYGITDAVVERILAGSATLVISADKGSSDEPRIKRLAEAGRDVVITDHHELPVEGAPQSALACVNPSRPGSGYDRYVCGAAVAWLTMALVRTELLKQGYAADIVPLAALLDYVAVATVADCVSLRPDLSYANRAFVKRGLVLINGRTRPCWQVFCDGSKDCTVTAQTIAFQLAPAVAAAGRLDWAEAGFRFLVAGEKTEALTQWTVLLQENEQRKAIEKELRERAFSAAASLISQSLVLFLEDGHSGVHGITASRLVERFGKPAAIFARKGCGSRDSAEQVADDSRAELASGSFRGVAGLHVRDALQRVSDVNPGLLVSFGGHAGAAGATIAVADFERFAAAYEAAVCEQLHGVELHPEVWVDGELDASLCTLQTVDDLAHLDPWGRDFPQPVFCGEFFVANIRAIGNGTHVKLLLKCGDLAVDAIWFNAIEVDEPLPVARGQQAEFAYQLCDNVYAGKRTVQLQIVALVGIKQS